jgi:hypothetical protein
MTKDLSRCMLCRLVRVSGLRPGGLPASCRHDDVKMEPFEMACARLPGPTLTTDPNHGIGSKTTSSREQNIVNVVSFVIPHAGQRPLALIQPLPALGVVLSGLQ